MSLRASPRLLLIGLIGLTLLSLWLSLALGPLRLPLGETLRALAHLPGLPVTASDQALLVVGQIRLPRTLMGLMVGAVLALTGVAMQGLFRNPLADPGLIGVSNGAALGAALAIVGGEYLFILPIGLQPYLLSLFAFMGGLVITAIVYRLGCRHGQAHVATMLLAGIALTAMAGAAIGLLTYLADNTTLRLLTSWTERCQLCPAMAPGGD